METEFARGALEVASKLPSQLAGVARSAVLRLVRRDDGFEDGCTPAAAAMGAEADERSCPGPIEVPRGDGCMRWGAGLLWPGL